MTPESLPCPECKTVLGLERMLDHTVECWPYRRWVTFSCPICKGVSVLLCGFEKVTSGSMAEPGDPDMTPHHTVEPYPYSASWSSGGMRVSLGEKRWTVRASDSD